MSCTEVVGVAINPELAHSFPAVCSTTACSGQLIHCDHWSTFNGSLCPAQLNPLFRP